MRIDGEWFLCGDSVVRPIICGDVLAADGTWVAARFQVDPGADRTVLSAELLKLLGLPSSPFPGGVAGVGGMAQAVTVATELRLKTHQQNTVLFRGDHMARTDPGVLELSLLGRDITDLFAVIVDRPGNVVCMLSQLHQYRIEWLGP